MSSNTELPKATKEIIALVVSKTSRSNDYCVTHHTATVVQSGISEDPAGQLAAGFEDADVDQKTRMSLEYAEKVTLHAGRVTDEDVEGLRQAGWTDSTSISGSSLGSA